MSIAYVVDNYDKNGSRHNFFVQNVLVRMTTEIKDTLKIEDANDVEELLHEAVSCRIQQLLTEIDRYVCMKSPARV